MYPQGIQFPLGAISRVKIWRGKVLKKKKAPKRSLLVAGEVGYVPPQALVIVFVSASPISS
jgi:hypothetical protein